MPGICRVGLNYIQLPAHSPSGTGISASLENYRPRHRHRRRTHRPRLRRRQGESPARRAGRDPGGVRGARPQHHRRHLRLGGGVDVDREIYLIPRRLDDPPQFFFWDADEAILVIVFTLMGALLGQCYYLEVLLSPHLLCRASTSEAKGHAGERRYKG